MKNFLNQDIKLNELNPLALAFVGDGVYELFVREHLAGQGNCPVGKLHQRAVKMVKAEAQAKALRETVMPALSEKENEIIKRGRNAHVSKIPKSANIADYHAATALEALFGYLYLAGETDRLRELFSLIKASAE